jgi:hypothetical protein
VLVHNNALPKRRAASYHLLFQQGRHSHGGFFYPASQSIIYLPQISLVASDRDVRALTIQVITSAAPPAR